MSPHAEPSRITALDGLRGIAILLVMARHWILMRPANPVELLIVAIGRVGWIGVDLFFALSGFLITSILLEARGRPHYWRDFYVRRVLRIWPPYLAVLLALTLLVPLARATDASGASVFLANAPWYWTHLTNVLVARAETFRVFPFGTAPFWSLAVEEQYYALWPVVIACCPSRYLLRATIGLAVTSAVLRAAMAMAGSSPVTLFVLTPTHLDGLAWGAVLAMALRDPVWRARIQTLGRAIAGARWPWWLVGGAGLLVGLFTLDPSGGYTTPQSMIIALPILGLLSMILVGIAVMAPVKSGVARLCRARWLSWLGRYSYAIYLIHCPVAYLLDQLGITAQQLPLVWGSELPAQIARIMVATAITLALTLLSWYALERPCARLKNHLTTPRGNVAGILRAA